MSTASAGFSRRCLAPNARAELLRSIAHASKRRPGEPSSVLVFDLDGTLLDNRPRFVRILHELAESWRETQPAAASKLARARTDEIVYGLRENLQLLGLDESGLFEPILEFWKERFFVDAYMKYDVPTPGGPEFVRACWEAGATIVYLTGRDLPNMAVGTFASLRDTGFPIGVVGTSLVTKPTFDMPDADFKHDVAPSLDRHGRVQATFDNEPANSNLFLHHHPSAKTVFLDTHHAPDPPSLDERALVIDSFEIDG